MEILPEMKAESSICCFSQILNLTPSAKNLGYRIDVKWGTAARSRRQEKEARSSLPPLSSQRKKTV